MYRGREREREEWKGERERRREGGRRREIVNKYYYMHAHILSVTLLPGVANRYSGECVKLFAVFPPHLLHNRISIQYYTHPSFHTLIKSANKRI